MRVIILLFTLALTVEATDHVNLFAQWMKQWDKSYSTETLIPAYETWKENYEFIVHHNSLNNSYTLEMNQFGDLSTEEFGSLFCGLRFDQNRPRNVAMTELINAAAPPTSVDWQKEGAVSAVQDQGACGACYTFAASGAIEGAVKIKTHAPLIPLSKQQLLDCSGSEGNAGCQGGLMDNAYTWVMKYGGITSDAQYPYTGRVGTCQHKPSVAKVVSFHDIPEYDEASLLVGVSIGPVSGGVEAKQPVFQFYKSGVLDTPSCGSSPDHAILIVGYGTDTSVKKDYWQIKNSWGPSWGIYGYVRLVRNKNQCGISIVCSYPIV